MPLYKHLPEPVKEAKGATILWDFAIQADRKIKSNRLDLMVKDNKRKYIPFNFWVSTNKYLHISQRI